jgi:hypothetical protein
MAMRRRRLVRLVRKLRAMRKSLPKRDRLLLRIGAAKKEAGRAFGFVKIQLPTKDPAVTRATFSFQVDKVKLEAAEKRDGHYLLRSNLTGEDPAVLWTRYVQLTQIESVFRSLKSESGHPAHLSSARASGRRSCPDCLPGLLPAGHLEESADDARAGVDAGRGSEEARDDSDGGCVDSHGRRPLAGAAAPYTTRERCPGRPEPDQDHPSLPTTAANQGLAGRHSGLARTRRSALFVVKTFVVPSLNLKDLAGTNPANCESQAGWKEQRE